MWRHFGTIPIPNIHRVSTACIDTIYTNTPELRLVRREGFSVLLRKPGAVDELANAGGAGEVEQGERFINRERRSVRRAKDRQALGAQCERE